MIKATELRIGNFVLGDTNIFNEVTGEGIKNYSEKEPCWNGIPLTEEYLLNFGFETYNDINVNPMKGFFKTTSEERKLIITKYSCFISGVFNPDKKIRYIHLTKDEIKFVHQLQNLYWCLTGIELEIKETVSA